MGRSGCDTHEVFNQSPPFEDMDLYASDLPLQEALAANHATGAIAALAAFGRRWGSAEMFAEGRLANEHPPILRSYDARGRRRDVVEFHPAYHRLMEESIGAGLHAMTWNSDGSRADAPSEVVRAACFYIAGQVEAGHLCPVTMTRAAVAALACAPALLSRLMPKIASRTYDWRFRPWWEKAGITLGMGMTEKQGGTDIRSNTTRAEPAGDHYCITGHKWFMSAPMCDAFFVLAQAPAGLTCFLMPRFRPDGSVNALRLQRLKEKLGNRSNASCEVEFAQAFAWRLGDEGDGVRRMIEMVQLARLDCAIASAALMRMALAQALHHARHRSVFQKRLVDQPMMRNVLAELALQVEAVVALIMRLCRSFDLGNHDLLEAARARLLTPAAKFWICKAAPTFVYEAMECLGGNGYVEESLLPRLYREAPVNAIWEGSSNVMALDVLRAWSRDQHVQDVVGVLARAADELPGLAETGAEVVRLLSEPGSEGRARYTVERLALLAAAAALVESAPLAVAQAFARARLMTAPHATYGTAALEPAVVNLLIERALPSGRFAGAR